MNLLNTLTLAADEEQLRLQPLPVHAAATQAEHLRRHYALLLAAVLTAQPAVSEPQTRLLRLLLDALKLGDIRGQLFEQARALEAAPLLEAARLIREAGFAHHLVVDTLVLLRLDAPMGDEAARLAGELAAFLGLDETALATRADDAAEILGLDASENDSIDSAADKQTDDSDDSDDAAATPAGRPLSLAEYWPGRLCQPLTVDALRSGLQGGLWLLDADMAVHFAWQASDAVLLVRNGAVLNTIAASGTIKLDNCRLLDAALTFQGNCSVTLHKCDWQGNYAPPAASTALHANGPAVTITACQFATRNARAIMVKGNRLHLTGSRFAHCGHAKLNGGAVWHSDHDRTIENCHFDRCLAGYGGALRFFNLLYGVNKCEFIACESRALQNKQAGDVAVYAGQARPPTSISDCVFRQTSLVIGDAYDGSGAVFVQSTQFQQANIYYHGKGWSNRISSGCTFKGGSEIERNFQ